MSQTPSIRLLTVHPEWVAAMVLLGKRVENRTWSPPKPLRQRPELWIHAGASLAGCGGPKGRREARKRLRAVPGVTAGQADACVDLAEELAGHVVARCHVSTWWYGRVSRYSLPAQEARWHLPDHKAWALDEFRVLDPYVPARGQQGAWLADPVLAGRLLDARLTLPPTTEPPHNLPRFLEAP